jgi:hypothetical protein
MQLPTTGAVLPDLDDASVAGLVPALLGVAEAAWIPEPARTAEQVVLLVLDGLGWQAIEEHRDLMPVLAGMTGGAITTVVPSTTATALTSIATGLVPARHGIVGYRMLVDGAVLNVLRWSVGSGRRAPDPVAVQRHDAFLGRPVPTITRAEFRTTGFTNAHLRGGHFIGWHTTAGLVEQAARSIARGHKLVYAYYPGVDVTAHEFGLYDRAYERELADTDRMVGQLLALLPPASALLVTADHGQVHLERDSWIDISALSPLVETMAGDGRFRYLYARKGKNRELLDAARDNVGDSAWVFSRSELLEQGVFGPEPVGRIPGRLGDVVLAARDAVAYIDPALPSEMQLRSGHGSLTAAEMYVPLVAARGGAQ